MPKMKLKPYENTSLFHPKSHCRSVAGGVPIEHFHEFRKFTCFDTNFGTAQVAFRVKRCAISQISAGSCRFGSKMHEISRRAPHRNPRKSTKSRFFAHFGSRFEASHSTLCVKRRECRRFCLDPDDFGSKFTKFRVAHQSVLYSDSGPFGS